ncbi:MAG: phosphatidate cytidylyltransferase [Candidatus Azobacteroides sp.]|nr:phosphatidate cytidylyltransferase [Candidatus Azobacteroides sp.]
MKNFIIRLLTGIVYVGTITFSVIYSSYTFLALFMVIIILCLREFYRLANIYKGTEINLYIHGAGGAALFLTAFLYISGITGRYIFSLYILYVIGTFIYELYAQQKNPMARLAYILFGQFYIALPFSVLNLLTFPDSGTNPPVYQWLWVIALLLFIWANDTGAYLIGVRFGKHRLWERISPKKSWEGFFGGLAFTIVAAFILAYFNPQIALYHWITLSIGVVVFSTYGDLLESLIKRSVEVKDSGRSLPGHGGFLDRFDSLLLAVYAMLFYMQLFIQN